MAVGQRGAARSYCESEDDCSVARYDGVNVVVSHPAVVESVRLPAKMVFECSNCGVLESGTVTYNVHGWFHEACGCVVSLKGLKSKESEGGNG